MGGSTLLILKESALSILLLVSKPVIAFQILHCYFNTFFIVCQSFCFIRFILLISGVITSLSSSKLMLNVLCPILFILVPQWYTVLLSIMKYRSWYVLLYITFKFLYCLLYVSTSSSDNRLFFFVIIVTFVFSFLWYLVFLYLHTYLLL